MTMYNDKTCPQCSRKFHTNYELDLHVQKDHPYTGQAIQVGGGILKKYMALSRSLYSRSLYVVNNSFKNVFQLFETIFHQVEFIFSQELDDKKCLKNTSELRCHFYKTSVDPSTGEMIVSDRTDPDPVFRGRTHSVYRSDSIRTIINSLAWRMCESVASFINKKSGWILDFVPASKSASGDSSRLGEQVSRHETIS